MRFWHVFSLQPHWLEMSINHIDGHVVQFFCRFRSIFKAENWSQIVGITIENFFFGSEANSGKCVIEAHSGENSIDFLCFGEALLMAYMNWSLLKESSTFFLRVHYLTNKQHTFFQPWPKKKLPSNGMMHSSRLVKLGALWSWPRRYFYKFNRFACEATLFKRWPFSLKGGLRRMCGFLSLAV